jgi:hypothetical protein
MMKEPTSSEQKMYLMYEIDPDKPNIDTSSPDHSQLTKGQIFRKLF